jgi:hypothetical protein
MDELTQWIVVVFFGIFQMVGGAFTGNGVRSLLAALRLRGDPEAQAAGFKQARTTLVSGCTFGFAAILFSALTVMRVNVWYFVAGVLIYLVVSAGAAFLPEGTLSEIGAGTFAAIGIGLAAVLLAILVGIFAFQRGEPLFGVIWAGIAGLVGLTFLSTGIKTLLQGGALDLHADDSGGMEVQERRLDKHEVNPRRKSRPQR